jgi:hypothetical protein
LIARGKGTVVLLLSGKQDLNFWFRVQTHSDIVAGIDVHGAFYQQYCTNTMLL